MAAGLGFKTFTTGEVLTAADTNGYLMQGILVFASAAARNAAITSPQEGQACYLKDTNEVLTYSGSAWVAVGGSGGMTLLASGSVAASSTGFDLTGISGSYEELKLKVMDIDLLASTLIRFRFNSDSGASYWSYLIGNENATAVTDASNGGTSIGLQYETFPTTANGATVILNLPNYSDSIGYKQFISQSGYVSSTGTNTNVWRTGFWKDESAITGISLTTSSSSFDAGATYELWGIK